MIIKEYRIVMPMTVEEYQIAQLYSVAQASKNETGGGEGIEVLKNEPFTESNGVQPKTPLLNGQYRNGQFTHKIYHLASKVPSYILWLAPKGALEIHEEAWNAYPYCRTVVTNPDYMKENFVIKIESMHLPDRGETDNAHGLDAETLSKREVVKIDIANDPVDRRDYKDDEDPTKYKSTKTGRGPLVGPDWQKSVQPVMTCYKLVTVEFKWWGLQGKVEKFIHKAERRIFTNFHRQVFCWADQWYGLTMADIRAIEDKTKVELDEYNIAHLYAVAEQSRQNTGGGEGVEVVKNEEFSPTTGVQPRTPLLNGAFSDGFYTHKIYHVVSKVPTFIRWVAPKGSLKIHEEAWNCYPYCRTVLSNPEYLKNSFVIKIESMHLPDRGETENALGLDRDKLSKRKVVFIDIANDPILEADRCPEEDPTMFRSEVTGRGPIIGSNWRRRVQPVMTCYKVVMAEFKWFGFQDKVENAIHKIIGTAKQLIKRSFDVRKHIITVSLTEATRESRDQDSLHTEKRLFTKLNRQAFCSMDKWIGLTMEDIRSHETLVQEELRHRMQSGRVVGMRADDIM